MSAGLYKRGGFEIYISSGKVLLVIEVQDELDLRKKSRQDIAIHSLYSESVPVYRRLQIDQECRRL
jgi:hypothetical protein